MNKLLRTLTVLASLALSSALFANQTIDLGYKDANSTISIATESNWDASFAIISNDTNQIIADVSVLYNGWWYSSPYDYYTYGYSDVAGVTINSYGQGIEITGIPAGNYRFESYTQWGNNSPSSYNYNSGYIYSYEEAPYYYSWGPIIQVSYFIW